MRVQTVPRWNEYRNGYFSYVLCLQLTKPLPTSKKRQQIWVISGVDIHFTCSNK